MSTRDGDAVVDVEAVYDDKVKSKWNYVLSISLSII